MCSYVDDYCDIVGAKIHKTYSCILNQTNIEKNSNKFYIMQIVTNGTDFWLYSRYGRIGDKGVVSKVLCNPKWCSVKKFCSTFYAKTGNRWNATPFESKKGRYTLMNIEEPEFVTHPLNDDTLKKLEPRVDDLIKMISAKQLMTKTLQRLNVDAKKFPLGKIKKEQLFKANEILVTLKRYLEEKTIVQLEAFGIEDPKQFREKRIIELSSEFWTLLPYSCGRQRPPVISNVETLDECIDNLNSIRNIEISAKIIECATTPEKIYENLKIDIGAIDTSSDDWKMLKSYVDDSQGHTHDKVELLEAFSIKKDTGDDAVFSSIDNHMLLFHGSRSANFIGIFSEGLRIPNMAQILNGAVLGTGIYFADSVTKSFNYCHDSVGLVLVCEVALGKGEALTKASFYQQLSNEYQSRIAYGRYGPLSNTTWAKDPKVIIPCGKLELTTLTSDFCYNEYVIYRKEQYRLRYLLKLGKI